jgi:hypothetical protein
MGRQKISFRKSAGSASGLVITLLLVMALFYGSFYYISSNYQSAGIPLDEKYQNMSTLMDASQNKLASDSAKIQASVQNISQAPQNLPYVAFYGLVGIATAVGSMWSLLDTSKNVFQALIPGMGFLPGWASTLVMIGITMMVVFILFKIFTGRSEI